LDDVNVLQFWLAALVEIEYVFPSLLLGWPAFPHRVVSQGWIVKYPTGLSEARLVSQLQCKYAVTG
jgi:hypothetical protein